MNQKHKPNFSKLLAAISITLFAVSAISGVVSAFCGVDTTPFMYIIPSTAGLATATVAFYYNKSKAENLSKQRIRYVLMKLLLEKKLSGDAYMEICAEIDNIDQSIQSKIAGMTEEAVNAETSTV